MQTILVLLCTKKTINAASMALVKTKWWMRWKIVLRFLNTLRATIGFFFLCIPSAIAWIAAITKNNSTSTYYCIPQPIQSRDAVVIQPWHLFGTVAYLMISLALDYVFWHSLKGKRLALPWHCGLLNAMNAMPEWLSLILMLAVSLSNCILFGGMIVAARHCHIHLYRRILIPSSIGLFAASITHLILSIAFSCTFYLPRSYFGHRNPLATYEAVYEDYVDNTQGSNSGDEDEPVSVESDSSRFQQTLILGQSILPTCTTLEQIREVLLSKTQHHLPLPRPKPSAESSSSFPNIDVSLGADNAPITPAEITEHRANTIRELILPPPRFRWTTAGALHPPFIDRECQWRPRKIMRRSFYLVALSIACPAIAVLTIRVFDKFDPNKGFLIAYYTLLTLTFSASILLAIMLLVSVFLRIEIPWFMSLPLILLAIGHHVAFWMLIITTIAYDLGNIDDLGIVIAKFSTLAVVSFAWGYQLFTSFDAYRYLQSQRFQTRDQFSMDIRNDKSLWRILRDLWEVAASYRRSRRLLAHVPG
ncbi:hypothetical protein F5884DRAFT_769560 [Xylogone sp. PMI_703]|nr:hypothetical protein F5884DRAFT_769560 [Xylogone sp. PMI_703]